MPRETIKTEDPTGSHSADERVALWRTVDETRPIVRLFPGGWSRIWRNGRSEQIASRTDIDRITAGQGGMG